MRLRARLLLAAAPLGIAVGLLGLFLVSTVRDLGRTSETILSENFRSVLAAERMKEVLERLDGAALLALAGQGDRVRSGEIERETERFEHELEAEDRNVTEVGERELVARLREAWTGYRSASAACSAAPSAKCYFAELEPRVRSARDAADRILLLNQDAMAAKSDRARREAEWTRTLAVVVSLGALALGMAATIWLGRRVVRPIAVLTQAVEALGKGDLAARALVRGQDEVAQLAGAFNAMADRIEEYRTSSLGELVQAQQAAQAAMDGLPDPVLVLAADGQVLTVNRAAEALLGAREGTPLRVDAVDAVLRDAIEGVRAHVIQGKGPRAPRGFEDAVTVERPGGRRSFLAHGEPVYEPGGGIVAAAVVLQEVTRLRRVEELHDDLVSTVAHQFRTPLTSLRMAVHLCLEGVAGPLTEKQADLLQAAREESERLQEMVDELLDLARLRGGGLECETQPVAAASLLETAHRAHRAAAEERGVKVELDPGATAQAVLADPERVQLVFANLIENAIRHSPRGGRVRLGAEAQEGGVRFEVADEGPGVPPEQRARVFEKFVRLPGAPPGGAGIGLSIARDLVRAHGGEIGVEDGPPGGALFWFTLPSPPHPAREDQTP
jgi:NtrC-family two-component system sensor histidine kinase KinB